MATSRKRKSDFSSEDEQIEKKIDVTNNTDKNPSHSRKNAKLDDYSNQNKVLPECEYGSQCYRKNPLHFAEYSHSSMINKKSKKNLKKIDHNLIIKCYLCYKKR
jgi:hypothetical protein